MRRWLATGILVVIIATAAGIAGYRLASHKESARISALQLQLNDLKKTIPKPSTATPSQKTSMAEIAPFKVSFPYGDKPAGLGYADTASDTVAFDSETLGDYANKLDPKNTCGLDSSPGPLGFLKRTTNLPLTEASDTQDGLIKQIGNYYYVYQHPKDCSTDSSVVSEQKSEVDNLISDLKNLR